MLDFTSLSSCGELSSTQAKEAAGSSALIRALIERFVVIARPGEGCPKILMAVARLVEQDWVEGPLRVEISGDDASTTMVVMCEYGVGIRERILPLARFEVPFEEFSRALELSPALALPLMVTDEAGKMVLTPLLTPEDRVKADPVMAYELDEHSLGEDLRKTAPPPAIPETAPPPAIADTLQEGVHEVPTRPVRRLADGDDE